MVVHVLRRFTLVGAAAALALATPALEADSPVAPRAGESLPQETPDFSDDVPAHISVVHGTATIEHDGKSETAEANMILLAGDRLRTTRGRLEVLYDDGSALHLDEYSTVDLLSDSLIRLRAGRLRLLVARTSSPIEYRVDAAPASTLIRAAGEYRFSLGDTRSPDAELRVVVLRGSVDVANDAGHTIARTGQEIFATFGRSPSSPYAVNSAYDDAFERWAQEQIDARLSVESAKYLPQDLRYDAGVFDSYGSWGYEGTYGGYVWYPRVAFGWRPYYYGNWHYYGHYGWTWRGYDRWSWATHHYGRWGYSNRWYWVPSGGWGPAWVAWGYAPGYVSWCPLGWSGGAVVGFSVRYGSIYGGPIYGPWQAWTVMPARAFAPKVTPYVSVAHNAVSHETISPAVRTQFAEARRAPAQPVAIARNEPLRAPTARAVPRSTSAAIAAAPGTGSGTVSRDSADATARRSGSGATGWAAPTRDSAVPRSRTVAPITPETQNVEPTRVRPASPSASWDSRGEANADDTGNSNSRAVSRSRSMPTNPPDSGEPETSSRIPASRMPSSRQPEPTGAPSRSIGSRWSAPESRPAEPVESRSNGFGSRVAPRSVDPGSSSAPPSRTAEPRGQADAPAGTFGGSQPSRSGAGSAPSRQPAPAAAPSRGGGSGDSRSSAAAPRGRGGR